MQVDGAATCVVVGSYNRDLLFRTAHLPAEGETCLGEAGTSHGGKGFNQAVSAVRLGAVTRFVGALGGDVFAEAAREFAADEGMDGRWELHRAGATGMASVVVDDAGANQIVVAAGANGRLGGDFVRDQLADLDQAVLVAQLETSLASVSAALEVARDRGWVSILDPAPVVEGLGLELLRAARVITPNEHEFVQLARRFLRLGVSEDLAHVDDEVLHGWCRRLGVDTVVLTLGKSGCFVSHAETCSLRPASAFYRVPGVPVTPVDSTGAGDCFTGALAAGLIRLAGDFPRACRFANQAASICVTRAGGAPAMPLLTELA